MSLIRLEDVSKYYKSADTVSVGMKQVNLSFDIGEFVAITGESGAGKSTLLNVLSGLDKYEEGEYYLLGEETSHYTIRDWERFRGAYIGFVFQDYNIIDSYTVLQNVLLALEVQGYDPKKRKARALALIDRVGLTSHKNHKASKLSGGQKQRCVIARALAKDCPIIVADEPTGNLDSESGKQVIDLLNEVAKEKLVIIVTHDYEHVEEHVTRKIVMHDGEVIEDKKFKKTASLETTEIPQIKNMSFGLLMRFAFRNLFSTPRKLIFMLLMQIIVVAVFTLVYTNQISQIRETGLNADYTEVFPSVPESRVLVEKRDGSAFTDQELTNFKNNRYTNDVYENGLNFINDQSIYYMNNDYGYVDYRSLGDSDTSKTLINSDVDGRIPSAINEIVITNYSYMNLQIGDTIEIYRGPREYSYAFDMDFPVGVGFNAAYKSIGEFEITGFDTLDRNRIFFSDAFLQQDYPTVVDPYLDDAAYNELYGIIQGNLRTSIDGTEIEYIQGDNLTSYDVIIENFLDGDQQVTSTSDMTFTVTLQGYGTGSVTLEDLSIISYRDVDANSYLLIDYDIMIDIINEMMTQFEDVYRTDTPRSIVSISVDGYHNGTRFIETIDQGTYKVYYPSNLADPLRDFYVFLYSVIAIIFLTIFGMFLYTIVHAVTKNVMAARKRDFAIFRSVGTSQTTLARLVVIEQVIMNVSAFIITVIGIQILSMNVSMIRAELTYMEITDYLILLIAFALFGAWLGLRFNRRVFKQTVIESLTSSKGGE